MNAQFLESVFDSNIQHPNFFNGRILTAQDLQDEQKANLNWSRYLAQAVGEGVVYGLNVTIAKSTLALEVSSGLAINRRGDALPLPTDTTVELVAQTPATTTSPFAPCGLPPATTLTSKLDTNYYLLALTNATQPSTQKASHNGSNGQPTCTSRYEQLGVQFKLVPLTNNDFVTPIPNDPKSRSRLAHACFGTDTLARYASNPFDMPAQYGLVDNLRTGSNARLTQCDVPLAVLQFQGNQVQFVDMWAVRRPCLQNGQDQACTAPSQPFVRQRRVSEAQACLLQFQLHLADLRTQISGTIRAIDYFAYLPAAGYFPASTSNTSGFNVNTFFDPTRVRQVNLDPGTLSLLFHQSFHTFPLDPTKDLIDIYPLTPTSADAVPYIIFMRRGLSQFLLTTGGNCTYTLNPNNWEASLTQIANGVENIHICLQAGYYNLTRPIIIRNKGHVKVTGAGNGTRLQSNNAETALYFENCQSVTVCDLYAENGSAKSNKECQGLQGVLSFYNCQEVHVERTALKCIGNPIKNSSCITVAPLEEGKHKLSSMVSTVRVNSCTLDIGFQQVGILLVNTRYAQVENNQLSTLKANTPSLQGIVIAGNIAKDVRILNNSIENSIQGIHVGLSHHEPSKKKADVAENVLIYGNTIHVSFPNFGQEVHGVFTGNCNSLVVENNYITIRRFEKTMTPDVNGIKVYGELGRRILVCKNHLTPVKADAKGFGQYSILIKNISGGGAEDLPVDQSNYID